MRRSIRSTRRFGAPRSARGEFSHALGLQLSPQGHDGPARRQGAGRADRLSARPPSSGEPLDARLWEYDPSYLAEAAAALDAWTARVLRLAAGKSHGIPTAAKASGGESGLSH